MQHLGVCWSLCFILLSLYFCFSFMFLNHPSNLVGRHCRSIINKSAGSLGLVYSRRVIWGFPQESLIPFVCCVTSSDTEILSNSGSEFCMVLNLWTPTIHREKTGKKILPDLDLVFISPSISLQPLHLKSIPALFLKSKLHLQLALRTHTQHTHGI